MASDVGDDLGDLHPLMRRIDPVGSEPEQLAGPQAPVGAEEDRRPVPGVDGSGRVGDLGGGEESHLPTLDAREPDAVDGIANDESALGRVGQDLAQDADDLVDRGGLASVGQLGDPGSDRQVVD